MIQNTTDKDLHLLLINFPFFIRKYIVSHIFREKLIEVIIDVGRLPEAYFSINPEYLSQKNISWQDLEYITKRITKFNDDNRAGIERTLHRISCIRNRQFVITGLTCRVGRIVNGTIFGIRDLLETHQSILILGKPGIGKTTIIREITRILSTEIEKRVVIIDTSNEIAGNSDIPHSSIGRARRMQVMRPEFQHQTMIEAVENHMPQTIVIDEISTELEVEAARTIAEKGIQLIATTHGNCLESLIKNPSLVDLIGGLKNVTLSDEEAKRRGTQKSILERKSQPTFQVVIEINKRNYWIIHENIKLAIDLFLKDYLFTCQIRIALLPGKVNVRYKIIYGNFLSKNLEITEIKAQNEVKDNDERWNKFKYLNLNKITKISLKPLSLYLYSYSISNNLVKEIIMKMGVNVVITDTLNNAGLIIGLKRHIRNNIKLTKLADKQKIPIYCIDYNSLYELFNILEFII